jgi:hypothetical protein
MELHKQLIQNIGMWVYFCDPLCPWQRSSNENMIGLVQQLLPKGTVLSTHSHKQLDALGDEISNLPRKGLDVTSSLSVFRKLLLNIPQHLGPPSLKPRVLNFTFYSIPSLVLQPFSTRRAICQDLAMMLLTLFALTQEKS